MLLTWKFMYVGKDIVCILALRDFILTLGLVVFVFWVRSSSFFGLGRPHFCVSYSYFFKIGHKISNHKFGQNPLRIE